MKAEREKGTYAEHDHDGHDSDHSDPADSGSRRDSAESTRTVSSATIAPVTFTFNVLPGSTAEALIASFTLKSPAASNRSSRSSATSNA